MNMKRLFLIFWLILLCGALAWGHSRLQLKKGHDEMCLKLKAEFLEGFSDKTYKSCLSIFDRSFSLKSWEKNMNSWLGRWGWSHLAVYPPAEHAEIWDSETKNTGVRLKYIGGEYLVFEAHPKSSFKKGDIILSINGEIDLSFDKITSTKGLFRVERSGEALDLDVDIKNYEWDDSVRFEGNKVIVPSFRGEFFEDEALEKMKSYMDEQSFKTLVVDLRENYGGNIAAGLRLLSLFFCKEQVIGKFVAPSKKGKGSNYYPLEVDQSVQVDFVKKYYEVKLKTLNLNWCYKGPVKVLISSSTSSTAEMVAQAFMDFKRAKVIGEVSSGRMLLSSWEKLNFFPEGYFYSFPYALYESASGASIESMGVLPDEEKTYDLELEKKGLDSFLL